jgi:hypothetical protein
MEDFLLFNISNNACFTYLKYKGDNNNNIKEGLKILPSYPILKLFLNYFFTPLKPALHNLDKNVCFLDIDEKYSNIRVSCDWCSICNGVMETYKENIIKNPNLLKQIDFKKLKVINEYLDFVLIDRTEKLTNEKIENWCKNTFGIVTNDLLLLSQLYLKGEMIELKWCPFKRSKEFYYRNKDNRYLEPTEQMIYEVGKILSKYETITCNNCPKVVNENWKYTKSNKKSIFQPLLNYFMEEINKT